MTGHTTKEVEEKFQEFIGKFGLCSIGWKKGKQLVMKKTSICRWIFSYNFKKKKLSVKHRIYQGWFFFYKKQIILLNVVN